MKTEVIMKRELMGCQVSQKSKSEFLSATDLVKAGNRWRAINGLPLFNDKKWFKNKATQEFICELEKNLGCKVRVAGRGKGAHTWIHPFLFIDMALAISPTFKLETYKWIYDDLLKYRNNSGDSYKRMSGAVIHRIGRKVEFTAKIQQIAKQVREACEVSDWQEANQQQLKKRDDIHNAIELYSDVMTDIDEIVRLAIKKYEEE